MAWEMAWRRSTDELFLQPTMQRTDVRQSLIGLNLPLLLMENFASELFHKLLDSQFEPEVPVNNAGLIYSAPLVNMIGKGNRVRSTQALQQVLTAHLFSVFYVTGQVVDRMLRPRTKGVVISISSISACGNPRQCAYSAAKAGVNVLPHTWAKELGGFGIRFVSIAPGFLDTPSTRDALSENILAKLKPQIPFRRFRHVEHVYQAAGLAIENDCVSGTFSEVDGGLVI